jgi:hypothetical protein
MEEGEMLLSEKQEKMLEELVRLVLNWGIFRQFLRHYLPEWARRLVNSFGFFGTFRSVSSDAMLYVVH